MNAQDVLNQLLATDGEDWFLTKTAQGRATITTTPCGVVVGIIECHQPDKSSNDDSTTTHLIKSAVKSSDTCEPCVSSLR